MQRAGLEDANLHFQDLRETAITRPAVARRTVPQIAAISGHALATVASIIDRYVSRSELLAKAAISALEANEARSEFANRLQSAPVCSSAE